MLLPQGQPRSRRRWPPTAASRPDAASTCTPGSGSPRASPSGSSRSRARSPPKASSSSTRRSTRCDFRRPAGTGRRTRRGRRARVRRGVRRAATHARGRGPPRHLLEEVGRHRTARASRAGLRVATRRDPVARRRQASQCRGRLGHRLRAPDPRGRVPRSRPHQARRPCLGRDERRGVGPQRPRGGRRPAPALSGSRRGRGALDRTASIAPLRKRA